MDTSQLSQWDIEEIFNVEQDMWAREEGLWEYLQCLSCNTFFSKQDIYRDISKSRYNQTVWELEQQEQRDIFCCTACWGKRIHCFSKQEYVQSMRERYKRKSVLVLMRDGDELAWFMDGYVSDLETIYNTEFKEHYEDIGINTIKQRIIATLGDFPVEYFSCASSWTREEYMNFFHIYSLLQQFFLHFPEEIETVMWLSELHSGGPYEKIFSKLWTRSIWIRAQYEANISTSDGYDSDIYVHPNFWRTCWEAFSDVGVRDFIRANR